MKQAEFGAVQPDPAFLVPVSAEANAHLLFPDADQAAFAQIPEAFRDRAAEDRGGEEE